jgi:hypothetical protein
MQELSEERQGDCAAPLSNLSAWLRDHVILASLLILVCSVAPRLFLTITADPKDLLRSDSFTYLTPALNLLEHGAFLNRQKQPEVDRTPGYPVFLMAIMSLVGKDVGGQDLHKVLIAQTVFLSWSVVIIYWLARRILPPVMAFTGSLLAAFSPWGVVWAGLCLTEGLYVFVLAAIFLLMKLVEEASKVSLAVLGSAAMGLLTAAAVLVRPLWPLVLLVAGALIIQYGPRRKGAWIVLMVMLITATMPLVLWKARNAQEAHFDGISSTGGKTTWRYLAARVTGQIEGRDPDIISAEHTRDESEWRLSIQELDNERWRRAIVIFREHPVLTAYCFARSVVEHILHPMPYSVSTPAKLYLSGDYWVLSPLWGVYFLLWGGYLSLASLGLWHALDGNRGNGTIDRDWLVTLLGISLLLTFTSGLTFGDGSRMRISFEFIIPLLAGIGLIRVLHSLPGHSGHFFDGR